MKLARALGINVKRLRLARGMSQEALAHAVDLAPTYVGQIERGNRNPTLEIVERLAKVLGAEPLELLRSGESRS